MAVTIRLARQGAKKHPHYRVVVTNTRSPRDGKFLEWVGTYTPAAQPPKLDLDIARIEDWMTKGALPSATVKALIRRHKATPASPA